MSDPYYLHRLVWRNDVDGLKTALEQDKGDIEVSKGNFLGNNSQRFLMVSLQVLLWHLVTGVLLLPSFLVEGIFIFQTRVRRFC
jgi:hypothetical protein